ncbi:hypothetical protein PUR28_12385 [Streptomyces sp. BE308]|uniref:hypothetical protein n=1 Tax=Streptomyces sp. BE308 TaxID=3002529 RepID=UPI002E786ED8|nr:hypothetical protein [Streptomyces sp. BE308]MEE1791553.1 hypothetical protein [Streptomyces sp. BE308]
MPLAEAETQSWQESALSLVTGGPEGSTGTEVDRQVYWLLAGGELRRDTLTSVSGQNPAYACQSVMVDDINCVALSGFPQEMPPPNTVMVLEGTFCVVTISVS